MKTLFEYEDYRAFLIDFVASQNRGAKLRLAAVMECQPGYISQILSGQSHPSSEQAERFCSHLGWDTGSTQYFLNLVAFARAGSASLRKHLKTEIARARGEALVLKNRFRPEKILSVEDQATFYSSWHYGALHVAVSIPGCDSEYGLSEYFGLPLKRVHEVVQFLVRVGLVKDGQNGRLEIGSTQIYIGSDSPLISKHHTNWRVRAIESLDRYGGSDLHYSSVISVSAADASAIRELMAQTIEKIRSTVRASKDEKCFSYALDLFELGGS